MFNYFIDKYQSKEIIAISDRSYSDKIFSKLGFEVIEKTTPNCYFIEKLKRYISDINNENLKIYDSGNLIYKHNN